jgi:hypothetical protein
VHPVDEPPDLSLDLGARRQHADRLVQIQRAERAQLAPDRHPQRIGCAGAGRRDQEPWLPGVLLFDVLFVRRDVTSVSQQCYAILDPVRRRRKARTTVVIASDPSSASDAGLG